MEYNHCQLLLNKQELNIILQVCQCSKKGRELAVISLSPSEFSNTTCLSCGAAFVNRTFDYTNRSVIERSIGFDYQSFGNRTFDCV